MTSLIISAGAALAQDYDIDWRTVHGGGEMFSTGGDYELGGTIGQPDVNELVMSGRTYSLTGGFWAVPPCWCLSDMNNDGLRNGEDIQDFVDCLLAVRVNCACADLDTSGVLDMTDVATFISGLLAGGTCP